MAQILICVFSAVAGFGLAGPFPPDIDGGSVDACAEVDRIIFFDHFDAGAAVFSDLVDVGTFQKTQADIGMA